MNQNCILSLCLWIEVDIAGPSLVKKECGGTFKFKIRQPTHINVQKPFCSIRHN